MYQWYKIKEDIKEISSHAGTLGNMVQQWLAETLREDSSFTGIREQQTQGIDIEFRWRENRYFSEVKFWKGKYVNLSPENIEALKSNIDDGMLLLIGMNNKDDFGWGLKRLRKFDLDRGPNYNYEFYEMRNSMKNSEKLIELCSILDSLFFYYVRDRVLINK